MEVEDEMGSIRDVESLFARKTWIPKKPTKQNKSVPYLLYDPVRKEQAQRERKSEKSVLFRKKTNQPNSRNEVRKETTD